MKRIVLICLIACSFLSACEKKDGDPSPVNPNPVTPNPVKPVPVPDAETISATINPDGTILLKGKINRVVPGALDYGFMATKDSLLRPVWYMFKNGSKPVVGEYERTFRPDSRWVKGEKIYFSATQEISKQLFQPYNFKTFVVPE